MRALVCAPTPQDNPLPLHPRVHHVARDRAFLQYAALPRALACRGGTAHDAPRAVDRRVEGPLLQGANIRVGRVGALDNHGVVTHRAAHEPLLAGEGRRRPLPHHVEPIPAVLFDPREVVVVVHEFHLTAAEQRDDLARHPLPAA